MFFMVLVALVGLGLGMFQLFHLQKELTELRESASQRHTESSLEKQIGHPNLPSEKKELRKVAHLTGLYLEASNRKQNSWLVSIIVL